MDTGILVPLFPALDFARMDIAAFIGYVVPALLILILPGGRLVYLFNREQILKLEEIKV